MDIILSEMGQKWQTLSKDQQVALAQAVAGVRQYNQLVSLMDNWDIFEQNLQTAYSSTGSLDEQAEIYSESWQAASKRVKASLQDIYDSIINDEAFIDLLNGIESVIDKVGTLVDSIGGLKGVALATAVIFTRAFKGQIVKSIDNTIYSIRNFLGNNEEELNATKKAMYDLAQETIEIDNGEKGAAQTAALQRQLELANLLYNNSDKLSEEDRVRLQSILDINKALNDQVEIQAQLFDESNKQWDKSRADIRTKFKKTEGAEVKNFRKYDTKTREEIEKGIGFQESVNELFKKNRDEKNKRFLRKDDIDYDEIKTELTSILNNYEDNEVINFNQMLEKINTGKEEEIREVLELLHDEQSILEDIKVAYADELRNIAEKNKVQLDEKTVQNYMETVEENLRAEAGFETAVENEKRHANQIKEDIEISAGNEKRHKDRITRLVETAERFSSIGFAVTNLKYSLDQLNSSDISFFDKILISLTNILPMAISVNDIFKSMQNSDGKLIGKVKDTFEKADKKKNNFFNKLADTGIAKSSKGAQKLLGILTKIGSGTWIGIIISAFEIITAIINEFTVTGEEKLKQLEESTTLMSEQAENAKNKYNELNTTISSYQSAKEGLNKLKEGTIEFNEALLEANKTALELLEKYPSLSEFYSIQGNGLIEIDDEGLEQVAQEQYKNTLTVQYASQNAQSQYSKAKSESDILKLAEEISGGHRAEYISGIIDKIVNSEESSLLLSNQEYLQEQLNVTDEVANIIMESKTEIEKLATTVGESNKLLESTNKNLIDSAIDAELGEDYDDVAKAVVSSRVSNETEVNTQDILAQLTNEGAGKRSYNKETDLDITGHLMKNNVWNDIPDTVVEAINMATGENWKSSSNGIQGFGEDRIFEFINEEGEVIQLRAEQVASLIASNKALDSLTTKATEATEALNKLDESSRKDISNFLENENFDTMTQQEVIDNFSPTATGNITKENAKQFLIKLYGSPEEVDKFAESMGISTKELINKTEDAAQTTYDSMTHIIDKITSDNAKQLFNTIDTSEFTIEAQNSLASSFNTVYDTLGREGAQLFIDSFNEISKSIDIEDFANNWNNIDWENASVEYIRQQFDDLGISIDRISDGALKNLIDLMQSISEISFDSASASFKEISEITKSITKNNSIISSEQFDTLNKAGVAADAYFQKMADGTYKLTEDADQFSQMLHDVSLREMRSHQKNLYREINSFGKYAGMSEYEIGNALEKTNQTDKMDLLLATGNISKGEYDDISAMDNAEKKSKEINKLWKEAAISAETISGAMTEAAQDLEKTQDAIDDADFEFEVQQADLDVDETDRYANRIAEDMAKQNGETDRSEATLKKYNKAAREAAINNQRLDRGIQNLNNNLEDYKNALSDSNKGTAEYSKTLDAFKKDLADIFGIDDADLITDSFAETVLASEDLQKALNGDIEAIQRLKMAVADDIMINIVANQSSQPNELLSQWNSIKQQFANFGAIYTPEMDQSQLIESFNQMIEAGQMTKDQIESTLAALQISADVQTDYVQQDVTTPTQIVEEYMLPPTFGKITETDEDGKSKTKRKLLFRKGTRVIEGPPVTSKGYVPKYTIKGKKGSDGKVTNAFIPAPKMARPKVSQGSIPSSSGGGSGGSGGGAKSEQPAPAEKKDYTEEKKVVDRYYEITTSIEDMTDALEDASDAADRLYGKDRVKQMEKQRDLLKDQQKLLQQYRKEISTYLAKDKAALQNNKYGIKFSFDADGDIANYTNIMTNLYNQLHAAEQKYNSFATKDEQDAYNKSTLEPLNKKIEEIKELINTYDDTKNLLMDVDNQIQDSLNSWQDKNLEILTYKVELQIEVNDIEQEKLDYFINKYSDNFYKMAESQALLGDSYPLLSNNLATYQKEVEELNKAYQNGEISQSGYIESLKEVNSNILENLSSLVELDKQMIEYYSNTLDSAQNELGKFTSQLEHQASVLDHYKNVISLMGKENDFKMINSILEGQYDVANNQLEVQMKYLEALQRQKKEIESSLAKATGKEKEGLQKQLEALIPKLNEAEQDVFSLKESIIELSNSILENDLAKFAKELEKGMLESLGFNSMDKYLQTIDRLNASQEEYLTTTNKIYETNKLIRQAEQDLANTDSLIAKQKYKDYIQNIKNLSEQNKLSKYELEIAQARYEVLKAEIALEEVKNAKDSMRLMRDSQGNWNYVYTANQDKIDQAQQALEDAQNNLYNIGLNGAKDYQSKYAEIMQEAFEAFKEIEQNYKDGMYENDQEYNQARTEAQEYYYSRLKDIQELYQISHGLMVEESYQKEEDYIFAGIGNLEDFANATDKFLGNCNTAFDKWEQNSQIATDGLTDSMGNLNNKIDKVTDASESLSDQIVDDLIPSLEQELDAVRDVTQLWLSHRDALFETMEAYEKLQGGIQTTINSAAGVNPGGMLPDIPEQYQQDYGAIMAAYIKQGGNTEDEIFQELLKQRNEKVEWLQAHGFSSDYYGTYGSETEQYFKEIMSGSGDREWFEYAANIYTLEQIREILKRIGISTFKTGGYTGDWGDSGKLSILHEKELVLNQNDTKNLLETIKVNKDIKSGGGLLNKLSNLIRNTVDSYKDKIIKLKDSNNTVEQKVDIQATFPNVTNSSEIEQAFNNLVNQAAQYSSLNRK